MSCGICLDNFVEPVVLPCGHIFCRKCLTANNLLIQTEGFEIVVKNTETDSDGAPASCQFCPHCRDPYPFFDEAELNKQTMRPVFFHQPEPVMSNEQHKQWVRDMAWRATKIERANVELRVELEFLRKDYAILKSCMKSVSKDKHLLAESEEVPLCIDSAGSQPRTTPEVKQELVALNQSKSAKVANEDKPIRPARNPSRRINPSRRLSQIMVVAPIILTEPSTQVESPTVEVQPLKELEASFPTQRLKAEPTFPTPSRTAAVKRRGTFSLKPRLGLLFSTFRRS